MRPPIVVRYLGLLLLFEAAFMLVAAGVDLLYSGASFATLAISAALTASFGGFPLVFIPAAKRFSNREALATVVGGWFLLCLFGAIPFLLWGRPFSIVDGIFESFSGFTTTGASILVRIEAVPAGLLFWRSLTHWMGGLGIIALALAIMPSFSGLGPRLFRSEHGADDSALGARNTMGIARTLVLLYGGLTALEVLALALAGMPVFDAITNSFGTIATGGFCPRDGSIASYGSLAVEIVVMVFMVLAGMNFAFLYGLLFARGRHPGGRTAALVYLGGLLAGTALVTADLHARGGLALAPALRRGAFQVISLSTSAGFGTADASAWPDLSRAWLIFASLVGGCVGSTSGAIKVDRLILLLKQARAQIAVLLSPRVVYRARLDREPVPDFQLASAASYVGIYLLVVFAASLAICALGAPLLESFTGAVACMGNIGPGMGTVGTMGNYAGLGDPAKLILSGVMLVGRLEIFGILLLFRKRFWR